MMEDIMARDLQTAPGSCITITMSSALTQHWVSASLLGSLSLPGGDLVPDLGPLYHWSPRGRLKGIQRQGLVPEKRNLHGSSLNPDGSEFRQPAVCTSLDAATAWAYSHGAWKSAGTFDLWQFWLVDSDSVEVRRSFGPRIVEVRVHNRVKKGRLIWIGERTVGA